MNKFGHCQSGVIKIKEVLHSTSTFPLTNDGNYNIEYRKLCNIKAPTEETDVASKLYVDSVVKVIEEQFQKELISLNDFVSSYKKHIDNIVFKNIEKITVLSDDFTSTQNLIDVMEKNKSDLEKRVESVESGIENIHKMLDDLIKGGPIQSEVVKNTKIEFEREIQNLRKQFADKIESSI